MKFKIILTLLFCTQICFGQKLIQEINSYNGSSFGAFTDLSGDNSTLVVSRSTAGHKAVFYERIDGKYELSDSIGFPSSSAPVPYLSHDGKKCLLFSRSGVTQTPNLSVYAKSNGFWIQLGQNLSYGSVLGANLGKGNVDFSADGTTLVLGNPRANSSEGMLSVYAYDGQEWIQKGQTFQGGEDQRLGRLSLLSQDGNTLIISTGGSNASITTWDFMDGEWMLRPSIITGDYANADISEDGNVMVAAGNVANILHIWKFQDGEWVSDGVNLWPEHLPQTSWFATDLNMNASGSNFVTSYISGSAQTTALSVHSDIEELDMWVERRLDVTTSILYDYYGAKSEINASGDTIFVTNNRYNGFAGRVHILEDQRIPHAFLSTFLDIDCDSIQDPLEPFVPNPIFDINDNIIYFGAANSEAEVKLEEGTNKVEFINSIFKTVEDSYTIEGKYLYPQSYTWPVKYIDTNTVNITFNGWADTYVCNRSTDFSFNILNLSPKDYDVQVELKIIGTEPMVFDTVVVVESEEMLQPLETFEFNTALEMPDETFTNEVLDIKAKLLVIDPATQIVIDSTILDMSEVLRCSYDPNDKAAFPIGILEEHYTLIDQPIQYRIRFQNTGNYPARDVVITDQLDENFDWSSFEFVKASHEVTSIDQRDGMVTFNFKGIQLPDSINNEPMSHGFVMYSIHPKAGLEEKTVVTNEANIYFDFNAPILTNETYNTLVSVLPSIDVSTKEIPNLKINAFPNPVADILFIESEVHISRIEIFDNKGRLVSSPELLDNSIRIEDLMENEIYYLKCYTDQGIYSQKIIK